MFENELQNKIYDGTTVVLSKDSARKALKVGIDQVVAAVGGTMGPKGRCVIIQTNEGSPVVTKDGITVAKSIRPRNNAARIGAQLITEAALKTNDEAGDGTTTSTVLAGALIHECEKLLSAGHDAIRIRHELDAAAELTQKLIEEQVIRIDDLESLQAVATISANGDSSIGKTVASAVFESGRDGVVSVEDARGVATTLELTEGLLLDRGYISHYFITDRERLRATYDDAFVLVTDRKLTSLRELIPVLELVQQSGKGLLIIADDITDDALQGLVLNRTQAALKVAAVKAPGMPHQKLAILEDIAALVGGNHPFQNSGGSISTTTLADLGQCKRFVVDGRTTTIVGTGRTTAAVAARASELRAQIENPLTMKDEQEHLKKRLARLTSGAACIRVGGATEMELTEKKYRVEDALNATRAALDGGILPGGGSTLVRIAVLLGRDPSASQGQLLLSKALLGPFQTICRNAGEHPSVLLERHKDEMMDNPRMGWNIYSMKFLDLIADGVIDPAKVTKLSVSNAVSVASVFLQLDSVILGDEE